MVLTKLLFGMLLFLPSVAFADKSNKDTAMEMYLEVKAKFREVPELKLSEVSALLKNDNLVFIDAREKKERAISTIPGAISKDVFESDKEKYKNKTIAVYCTIGYRSAKYIQRLKKKNILAYNLEGSLLGWVHANQAVTGPRGKVVKKVHVYGRSWNHLPKGYEGVW